MKSITDKHQIRKELLLIALIILTQISLRLNGQKSDDYRYRGIETGSETRYLQSELNGTTYKLLINLPQSYMTDSTRTYPVFYVLDGQWAFVNVVTGYYDSFYDGLIPEIIIVGLTWAGDNPDYGKLRSVDYAPPVNKNDKVSGGDVFLSVLRKEIIPFIDSEYRSNKKDRGITGNSLSALYAHYCLFHANDLFNGFAILGPGFLYGNDLAFRYEEDYADKNDRLPARVLMECGEYDDLARIKRMADQITSRNYKDLDFKYLVAEGMGHAGIKSEGHARGMIFIYKRPYIQQSDERLREYEGIYKNKVSGASLKLIASDGKLVFTETDFYQNSKIYPVNDTEFTWEQSYNDFQFTRDNNSKVKGFTLKIYGRALMFERQE